MHISHLLATYLTVTAVSAQIPKFFGGRDAIADLKTRGVDLEQIYANHGRRHQHVAAHNEKEKRQGSTGQCGPTFGSCAEGLCCSASGWCGSTEAYCKSPLCLLDYGPACDANIIPPGPNTKDIPRTKPSSVLYGSTGVYSCKVPGTIALTYDDGPSAYTAGMLDLFKKYNARATFFITGNNNGKGEIDNVNLDWPAVIKRMKADGHQLGSHTWSHQDLSAITAQQRLNQMYYLEMAMRNIVGVIPTYMRPPYSSCNADCQSALADLGYHIIYFDLDTDDYNNPLPSQIQVAKNNFDKIQTRNASGGDWLMVGHDIVEQTATNLTAYMLEQLTKYGYKAVTVGECLGDPEANWYRTDTRGSLFTSSAKPSSTSSSVAAAVSSAAPGVSPTAISTDASCGGNTGKTCKGSIFGNCCSSSGWCGSTDIYCGTGCQVAYGLCGSDAGAASVASSAASSAAGPAATALSLDARCGGTTGQTCKGTTFGNCCSVAGWCGNTDGHCGTGCQPSYGTCGTGAGAASSSPAQSSSSKASSSSSSTKKSSSSSSTKPATSPTASPKVSTNGNCGSAVGLTCAGSTYGNCCGAQNTCGRTSAFCGTGCQKQFSSGCT